jgi:hypothetical protein
VGTRTISKTRVHVHTLTNTANAIESSIDAKIESGLAITVVDISHKLKITVVDTILLYLLKNLLQ